jgi:hypothetical protein
LIRPTEEGGSSGEHWRFAYYEVNLAAILNELRRFNVALPGLRQLAERFHDIIDWMEERGITPESARTYGELIGAREEFVRLGHVEVGDIKGMDDIPDIDDIDPSIPRVSDVDDAVIVVALASRIRRQTPC